MRKKLLKIRRSYQTNQRRQIRRFRLLSRHPFAVPVVTFLILAAAVAVGVLFFGGTQVTATDSLIVIISHDHVEQTVPTHQSTTVGALLNKLHIRVNYGDVVEPSLKTVVNQDGFRINVYRAVPVEIVDGTKKVYTFSASTTPRSVANQAGTKVFPEDNLNIVPTTNFLKDGAIGERLIIDRATPVHLNLYGTQLEIRTHAKTVGALLRERHITLGKKDSVKPKLSTRLKKDQQIFILRRGTKIISVKEEIPAPVKTINDPSLSLGTSAIRQQGSPGKKVVTYQIKLRNGKEVGRKVIQTVIVTPPVQEIVVQGTAVVGPGEVTAKITYWANRYGVSPSYMLQIARCESNFNPGSVNPYGYKGLYQYGAGQWSSDTAGAGISGASIWDPNAQAHAAAWHISNYGAGAWSCG